MSEELKRLRIGSVELVAVKGDITQEQVDCIVNAANSHLAHGGGVAGAIARRGGEVIRRQSREWVQKYGPVPVGEVAVTAAGELPARYVVHAVGPRWGEGNEEKKLRSAVRNALLKADELGCRSVSLPAISTGIFGYPKEEGVRVIVDETKKTIPALKNVREIRFCNIDNSTALLFVGELNHLSEKQGK